MAKTRFIEYTDDTFTTKKPQPEWLGILGPIIRAEVGDEVDVTFIEPHPPPHNMHRTGCVMTRTAKGLSTFRLARRSRAAGHKFTYRWLPRRPAVRGGATEFDCVCITATSIRALRSMQGCWGRLSLPPRQSESGWVSERCGPRICDFVHVFDEMAGKPPGCFTRSTDSSSAIFRDLMMKKRQGALVFVWMAIKLTCTLRTGTGKV